MSIHEHLPPQARKELKEIGWTKGREMELAKLARAEGQPFDCATRLHNRLERQISRARRAAFPAQVMSL